MGSKTLLGKPSVYCFSFLLLSVWLSTAPLQELLSQAPLCLCPLKLCLAVPLFTALQWASFAGRKHRYGLLIILELHSYSSISLTRV